jgi:hypothetical protein
MLPTGIVISTPLTTTTTVSGMHQLRCSARGQIGFNWNCGLPADNLIDEEFGSTDGSSDSQALMAGRQIDAWISDVWAN